MEVADLGVIAGVLEALIFFGFLAVIIIGPRYLRSRDRARLHETLRIAYEKGQPVPPELIEALINDGGAAARTAPVSTPERDLRRGMVLVFVGLGCALAGYALYLGIGVFSDDAAWITAESMAAAGAIPGFIGLAYLVLWLVKRNSAKA